MGGVLAERALTFCCSERFEPKAMRVAHDSPKKRLKRSDHRCHGPRWNPVPMRPLPNCPVRLSLGQVGQASLTAIETNPRVPEAEDREAVKIGRGHGSSETRL